MLYGNLTFQLASHFKQLSEIMSENEHGNAR